MTDSTRKKSTVKHLEKKGMLKYKEKKKDYYFILKADALVWLAKESVTKIFQIVF